MKIGIAPGNLDGKGYGRFGEEMFRVLKRHGYDAIDYNMAETDLSLYTLPFSEAEAVVTGQRKQIEGAELFVSQVHGPWRYPPRDTTAEDRSERLEKMKWSIRLTAALGCENWVVHPIMPCGVADTDPKDARTTYELNLEFQTALAEFAADYGVTVCLENMPFLQFSLSKPADILRVVKAVNRPNFKICLDTGHVAVFRDQLKIDDEVRRLGENIRVLHVHDNMRGSDLHLMPRMGILDWDAFAQALKQIGFSGVFSLETAPPASLPTPLFEDAGILYAKVAKDIVRDLG